MSLESLGSSIRLLTFTFSLGVPCIIVAAGVYVGIYVFQGYQDELRLRIEEYVGPYMLIRALLMDCAVLLLSTARGCMPAKRPCS